MSRSVRVIGPGRAGGSLAGALGAIGWDVLEPVRRGEPVEDAARGPDLLVIATPDAVVADVAARVRPVASTVVAHLAGSLGLEVLGGHPRRAALHPLVSLPSPEIGARRLASAWFAVAGDPLVREAVDALGGRSFEVADGDRPLYHAAACVAANHLVALLGSVERVAATIGVPAEAYLDLAEGALANVRALGAAGALTGPAARGDEDTLDRHRDALRAAFPAADAARELAAYDALVELASRLAGREG